MSVPPRRRRAVAAAVAAAPPVLTVLRLLLEGFDAEPDLYERDPSSAAVQRVRNVVAFAYRRALAQGGGR